MNTQYTLWQDIVTATADLGPDATAMRIPLFVEFREPPRPWKKRVRAGLNAVAQFLKLPCSSEGQSPIRGVLFCFPHRTPSNINNLLPVAREAFHRGLLGGILTAGDLSVELHEFAGKVPIVSADKLLGELGIPERVRNAIRVVEMYVRIAATLSHHRKGFQVAGHRSGMLRDLVLSVQYGQVCKRVLDSWQPSCVISTSDFWPLEHQLCRNASSRGIPSLVIQHGAIDDIWWPFVADVYCLWGEAYVDQMCRMGATPDRLTALGMPATDKLFERQNTAGRRVVGTRARPVCLILSQTNGSGAEPEVFRQYRPFLTEAIRLTPHINWKVKLHPVEDESFYRDMGSAVCERLAFHPKHVALEEAVGDADVVTTLYSTAALECMVMDRPLIVAPAIPRVQEIAWWPTMGGGTYAGSAVEFQLQVNNLVSDRAYRTHQLDQQSAFLTKSFANRGRAAESIVDLLESYSS